MEISTFFRYRPSWRGLLSVLVFVAVTMGVAGYFTYRKPATYHAQATVFLGQIFPAGTPDYLLRPIANDYQSALELPAVSRAAAQDSGASQGSIAGGLQSEQVSTTANLHVTFDTTDPKQGVKVVRSASREALIQLADLNLARAQRAATSAQAAYDTAVLALKQYEALHGNDGTSQHNQLASDVDRTSTARSAALDDVATANVEVSGATNGSVISVGNPSRQPRLQDTIRVGVTAGVIAAMLGLGLLVLLQGRRTSTIHWTAPIEPSNPYELPRA